jgi:hypothetical protein
VLAGRDEDLPAQVAALLLRSQLVFPVHAGRAGRDHRLHQLEGVQHAAEPGLGVGDDRGEPVRNVLAVLRLGPGDLVGTLQRVVDPAHHLRHRVDRVQALVRVGLTGQVRVRGHLPAGQVDGLEPGPDLLDRLVAGQRAEGGHRIFLGEQLAQALGAVPGERELFLYRAAKAHHIFGRVGPLGVLPARVGLPRVAELGRLLADCLHWVRLPRVCWVRGFGTGNSGPKARVCAQTGNT